MRDLVEKKFGLKKSSKNQGVILKSLICGLVFRQSVQFCILLLFITNSQSIYNSVR